MDNKDQKPADNRSQFEKLVCDGMGYCCPYAFLRVNKQTGMIAQRLGMTPRTIRLWKARFKAKELTCSQFEACMKQQLIDGGK